jgi:hypothetical protein
MRSAGGLQPALASAAAAAESFKKSRRVSFTDGMWSSR